jgi:hypothetical protein
MKKIALINCYMGEFPWFFKFFLKSCEFNPTIDFFIFTDNILGDNIPENVKIIPFSLTDFNQLATIKLGFDINIDKPYKLCDFKPAYGFLFSEYLEGYDFWGITDIDVIYGRIREFMTDEFLDNYDTICVRHDFITACCMLFKNTNYVNNLFKKSKDYQMIFTSPKNYAFDETNFEQMAIIDKHDIFKIDCEIESMQHVILQEEGKGCLKSHFDFIISEGIPGKLKWDKGVFSYDNKFEIILYHLLNYKGNVFSNNTMIWDEIPDAFYIDRYNYRTSNSILTRFKVFYNDHFKTFLWNFIKRIDMFLSSRIVKAKVKNLEKGEYLYYLNKGKMLIDKDLDGVNYLVYGNFKRMVLYRMSFDKNYFLAKNLPFIFKLEKNESDSYSSSSFNLVSTIGYGAIYKKLEN